jgi:hypothetical protein
LRGKSSIFIYKQIIRTKKSLLTILKTEKQLFFELNTYILAIMVFNVQGGFNMGKKKGKGKKKEK